MSTFLDIAYKILAQTGEPMSAEDLTKVALEQGLLNSHGATPWHSMRARISTDILRKKKRSAFMRTASGTFALREWKNEHREFVANRFKKALFDEDVVVFEYKLLHKYIHKNGLNTKVVDLESLLRSCHAMRRLDAEDTKSVIQLVSFYVVKYQDKYLTYKRTKRLPESRLHGYYSIGFGGHLNPDDIPTLFRLDAPEESVPFIVRELYEELILKVNPTIQFRGLLYDDAREVSKQHLGIVYDVNLSSPDYDIGERGFLIDPKFESLNEILDRSSDFENWSLIIVKEEQCNAGQLHFL